VARVEREAERLREQIEPRWDAAREQRVWARLRSERMGVSEHARRVRRAWSLLGATTTLIVAALLVLALGEGSESGRIAVPSTSSRELAPGLAPDVVELADGSRLTPASEARYALTRVEAREVEVELDEGRVEFEVAPNPDRRFRVRAGEVAVEVIGTAFSVERHATRVVVEVRRGKVRVEAPGRAPVELERGARLELDSATPPPDLDTPEPEPERPVEPDANQASPTKPGRARTSSDQTRWRALAESGENDEAWSSLDAGGVVDRSDPEALMAAADVARLTRHPSQAIVWLAIVVDEHADSPLAPLASFTRGRLLLERLGDPAGAADAFAKALSLAPRGPLAEDALAREVEALAKAGAASEARTRAELFVDLYPEGQRRRAVEGWGGID